MPTTQMIPRQGRFIGYEYHETILDGTSGLSLIIPIQGGKSSQIACTMNPNGGSGKVQYTTSSDVDVQNDIAVWQDWPSGTVTTITSDALITMVSAVRGVSVSGDVLFDVIL